VRKLLIAQELTGKLLCTRAMVRFGAKFLDESLPWVFCIELETKVMLLSVSY